MEWKKKFISPRTHRYIKTTRARNTKANLRINIKNVILSLSVSFSRVWPFFYAHNITTLSVFTITRKHTRSIFRGARHYEKSPTPISISKISLKSLWFQRFLRNHEIFHEISENSGISKDFNLQKSFEIFKIFGKSKISKISKISMISKISKISKTDT